MTTSPLISKIINFTDVRNARLTPRARSRVADHHEQRREFRRQSSERLFLQIVQSGEPDLVGTTISSSALDASANGLKVASGQHIPTGSVIDLWVDDSAKPGKFFLSSKVCWVHRQTSGRFELGVQLLDGAATDIQAWRERHG
jgi:PilZ domain